LPVRPHQIHRNRYLNSVLTAHLARIYRQMLGIHKTACI
jgi:hypothetical protein